MIDYFNLINDNSKVIENNELATRLNKIDEPQKKYFISEELHNYFEFEFPDLITSSIIIILNSRIEVYTRLLCEAIERRDEVNIRFNEIKGPFLNKTKTFFKDNNLNGYSMEIHQLFNNVQKIRNCLVHCNGDLDQSRDEKYLLLLIKEGRLIQSNYEIIVKIDYCKEVLYKSKDAMIDLYNKSGFPMKIE